MLKPEFDREQLRKFNKYGYRSVAARYAQSAELMLIELEAELQKQRLEKADAWEKLDVLEAENELFPMQDGPPINRKTAEMIYEIYSNLSGSDQSLDRLAERGGFGWAEVEAMVDTFIRKRGLKTFNQLKKSWTLKAGGE